MLYEINLCCPCCGSHIWDSTPNDTFICRDCGEETTLDCMEPHYFEVSD